MYSVHNRDDLEKLKKLQESKSLLKAERLKEKLGKQDFHYDMKEVFKPVTVKHAEATKNQKQLSEWQLQAIGQQTQGFVQEYDEITNRNNQLVTKLVNSKQVDSSIVKTVSNLPNTQSQFRLDPVEGHPNIFTINHTNPQLVPIKGSTMTFQNGNTYKLNDPDLSYFRTNTQVDTIPQNRV